jgi:hypothetical protein
LRADDDVTGVRKLRTALNDPMHAVRHVFITALEMFGE